VSVTVVFKTADFFAVLRFRETFSSSSATVSTRLPSTDQKKTPQHGEPGINVSQMEVYKITARPASHGAADNDSSIIAILRHDKW